MTASSTSRWRALALALPLIGLVAAFLPDLRRGRIT